ncbi:hypothetical protein EVAR_33172_1 [Eumeta japonica]|uniref:Uncharacterized protein n=1 Tax=Eumeta variegata TaxID=151549 RepID=A0A4C1W187_EUMVA|nr:hypothetical protein EVAR_33172_1 [Eumeta japonica]
MKQFLVCVERRVLSGFANAGRKRERAWKKHVFNNGTTTAVKYVADHVITPFPVPSARRAFVRLLRSGCYPAGSRFQIADCDNFETVCSRNDPERCKQQQPACETGFGIYARGTLIARGAAARALDRLNIEIVNSDVVRQTGATLRFRSRKIKTPPM